MGAAQIDAHCVVQLTALFTQDIPKFCDHNNIILDMLRDVSKLKYEYRLEKMF